jgi:hypothetical protein
MKNLWPESFEENPLPSAKVILEEQAKLLSKLTGDIVFAEVVEVPPQLARLDGEFCFRFNIVGKFVGNYRFRVLDFAHDITLYPIQFLLDSQLGEELGIQGDLYDKYTTKVDTPEELETFLKAVLTSKRVQNVVGSILKLSK